MENYITKQECNKINKQLMEDIKEIKQDVKSLNNDLGCIKIDLAKLPETLKNNFADKRIETNFDKLVWLVISSVVLTILGLILKL
jgi:hypothetical protein